MSIKVIAAVYGTRNNGEDVTMAVQTRLDKGHDDVIVTNEALGGDPDKGATKYFGIIYQLPNSTNKLVRCASEGDRLELAE